MGAPITRYFLRVTDVELMEITNLLHIISP